MNSNDTLILFAGNLTPGKTKPKLSASIGEEAALIIYRELLKHMKAETEHLLCRKTIYYREFIPEKDLWPEGFQRFLQQGRNKGEKLIRAFQDQFQRRSAKVVYVAADYPRLSKELILQAFKSLDNHDVVIGPSDEGDYYLIGMNRLLPGIFSNIPWGTTSVLSETLQRCKDIHRHVILLPELYEVDEMKDLEYRLGMEDS